MQFRKITAFMKKNAGNNKDPRVQKLFKMLNLQFSKIDKELNVDTSKGAEEEPTGATVDDIEELSTDFSETVDLKQ
jgi:hypothetical protein